jgi:hypothetical protein
MVQSSEWDYSWHCWSPVAPSSKTQVDCVQRRILHLCLQRHFGCLDEFSTDQVKDYVVERIGDVNAGLHLCVGLLPTDPRPVDHHILLAAHALIDVWRRQVAVRTLLRVPDLKTWKVGLHLCLIPQAKNTLVGQAHSFALRARIFVS